MKALNNYGRNWKEVERFIGTRSASQARSHAQKYFGRYFELVTRGDIYTTSSPAMQFMSSNKAYKEKGSKCNSKSLMDSMQSKRTVQVIPSGKEFYQQGAIEQIQFGRVVEELDEHEDSFLKKNEKETFDPKFSIKL